MLEPPPLLFRRQLKGRCLWSCATPSGSSGFGQCSPSPSFLAAFVRNVNAPGLVMAGVISGGCFNVFGDWFFVFPLGMGMEGAAIATVLGTTLQCLIICSHLFRKRCRLKLAKPFRMGKAIRKIFVIGIGASLLDLGTVVLSTITNNQILRYGNAVEHGHLRRHDHQLQASWYRLCDCR